MIIAKEKLVDAYVNGKMIGLVLRALRDGPLTKDELSSKLSLKRTEVMDEVLLDLSRESVKLNFTTNKFSLTETGKEQARRVSI